VLRCSLFTTSIDGGREAPLRALPGGLTRQQSAGVRPGGIGSSRAGTANTAIGGIARRALPIVRVHLLRCDQPLDLGTHRAHCATKLRRLPFREHALLPLERESRLERRDAWLRTACVIPSVGLKGTCSNGN
jgi:hypothetical protein